ncbi:MAG: DUF6688 family protein [Planctomycetota bacterium]
MTSEVTDPPIDTDSRDSVGDLVERPIGQLATVLLFYCGLLAPVFAHLFLVPSLTGDIRYQTGLLKHQYGFVLTFGAMIWMYPLVLFSIAAFTVTVLDLKNTGQEFWARLGLSTSIPIGVLYHIAIVVRFGLEPAWLIAYHITPLVLWLLSWGYIRFIRWVTPNSKAAWTYGLSILFGGLTLVTTITVIASGDRSHFSLLAVPFVLIFYGSLIYSPLLMLASHGWLIARVVSAHADARRLSLRLLMSWVTWLGCLFAACRYAVLVSLTEYSKLPLEDPGTCFVATAACRGHRRVVRAGRCDNGGLVSPQLQRLKGFEIGLRTLFPRFHRGLRVVYNALGPRVARRVRSPWAGDLCYLALKPAEWFALLVLWGVLHRDVVVIRQLYRQNVR